MSVPQIRIVVLDTTGPAELLRFESWPRERAFAFHGQSSIPVSLQKGAISPNGRQSHGMAASAFPALAAPTYPRGRKAHR